MASCLVFAWCFASTRPVVCVGRYTVAPTSSSDQNSSSAAPSSSDQNSSSAAASITTAEFPPGTLQIFEGWRSLHRVRPISPTSTRDRLVAVMCFAAEPGVRNSADVQRMFWGRTDP